MKKCKACGDQFVGELEFCLDCKDKTDEQKEEIKNQIQKKKTNKNLVCVVTAATR